MKIYPNLVVCPGCDSVFYRRALRSGETAHCERCEAQLFQADEMNTERMLALTIATAVTFLIGNIRPVLTVSFQATRNDITVWQAMLSLAHGNTLPLAMCALFLLIIAPAMQIALLAWILPFAHYRQCAPGFIRAMKTLMWLHPWSLVEVGVLGFLVAAIKLADLLDISPGPGTWPLAASVLLLTIIGGQDIRSLWLLKPISDSHEVKHHV